MKGVYLCCLLAVSPVALGAGTDVEELLDKRLGKQAVEEAKQEEAVFAKRERQAFLVAGQEVTSQADHLIATISQWETSLTALLVNDQGRSIAANQASVEQFMYLQQAERMSLLQAKTLRAGLDTLLEPITTTKDGDSYTPTEKLRQALEEDARKIQAANSRYRTLDGQLKAILNQAGGARPAQTTLEAAISEWHLERGKQELARQQQEEENKRTTELARQNTLESERARQEELDRQQQIALEKSQRDHQRLLKEAQNPVLIQSYAPFLERADHILKRPNRPDPRNQDLKPDVNGYWPRIKDDRPAPLSLSVLNDWNALNDVDRFSFIIFVKYNERSKGNFRKPVSEADWIEMEKRMKEFAYYAPLWVELGLLNR